MAGRLSGAKDRVTGTVRGQRARRPWFDHVLRAYRQYKSANGDHLAAAVTYFSFLAIFPLLLLGVSVAGFVLANNDALQEELRGLIEDNVPGSLGDTLSDSVASIIDNRGSIGLIALVGVAYAGLGWVGNLRTALQLVWTCQTTEEKFVKAKLGDLLVLIGLGLGIVVSLALTSGGTALAHTLIDAVGLDGVPGMGTLLGGITILLALAADTLIFMWMFVRLPRRPVRYRTVLRGAVLAAVGYEILKLVGTYYIALISANPTYGIFAGAVGLLVWIDLVSRFLLLAAAWTATGTHGQAVRPGSAPGQRRRRTNATPPAPSASTAASPPASSATARPSAPSVAEPADPAARAGRGDAEAVCPTPADGPSPPGSTRVPTGGSDRGSANPQSSIRAACSLIPMGRCSPYRRVTSSRRSPRRAAPMKVCRAASVKPFLPANAPGYA